MPSPNGYFDCGTASQPDRNWFQFEVTHNTNSAPWLPGQAGNYQFEVRIGAAAAGPFTAAPLTDYVDECTPEPDNRLGPNGVTSTVFSVGGPAALLAGTDYWLEIILHGPGGPEVDRLVCGPLRTEPYPAFTCVNSGQTQSSADVLLGQTGGAVNQAPPCNQDRVIWELATAPGGPYTAAPAEDAQTSPAHTFTGLAAGTTYYWRARFTEQAQTGGEYLVTAPCSFTTQEAPVTTPPFQPQPCDSGGAGSGMDVEQIVLCDLDAEGNLLGTALAVYEYDAAGAPVGAPTFVDPVTGNPYIPHGTLQPCPDGTCLAPMQFCQTSTSTGPVEHPGRMYDISLPINPGFAVDSLVIDNVTHAAGINWTVFDGDGAQFATDLQTFMQGRFNQFGATVTVTNPNAGNTVCGNAQPMRIHIECVRLDQTPPNLVELNYNGGVDKIINPAYQPYTTFTTAARRTDAGGLLECTSVANRGWETDDVANAFEFWGAANATPVGAVTPTPRGTPIQEINANCGPAGAPDTIWQTFTVSPAEAGSTFNIRVVVGGRVGTEAIRIRLFTGDPAAPGTTPGDLIDTTVLAPKVAPPQNNPWTTYTNDIPLNAGTYTLAFTGPTVPEGCSFGGLFTDMRAFINRPGQRATAVNNDETCTVTTTETTTSTSCSFWQPQCVGGTVAGWERVADGLRLSNAEFWAQVPAPECCRTEAAAGDQNGVKSNMLTSDLACATVNGLTVPVIRVVVTDPSGGVTQEQFLGQNGAPVTPSSWTPGSCSTERFVGDLILCDRHQDLTVTPFLRKLVQTVDAAGAPLVNAYRDFTLDGQSVYVPTGEVTDCEARDVEQLLLCDPGALAGGEPTRFLRRFTYNPDGRLLRTDDTDLTGLPYVPVGTPTDCTPPATPDTESHILCDRGNGNHQFLRAIVYSATALPVALDTELDGTTPYATTGPVGVCDTACDPVTSTGLCLADGTPIGVVTRRDCASGTVVQDGWINLLTGVFAGGPPPTGAMSCSASQSVQVSGTFCDVDGAGTVHGLVLIEYHYGADGSIESVRLVSATTGATYVPVGTVTTCPAGADQPEQDVVVLCDVSAAGVATPFVRDFRRDHSGAVVGFANYTLSGGPYAPTGTVGVCQNGEATQEILCDQNGTRFLRTYQHNAAGAVTAVVNTTLAGAAFAPVGTVAVCATTTTPETDVQQAILCDVNGAVTTQFLRRWLFNSSTGAVTATQNLTLAGAAYNPTGTVGVCTSPCCPITVAEVCLANGHPGVILRQADGTLSRTDTVTGLAFAAGDIVPCTPTVSAQSRLLTAGQSWTPGADVTGTATSVTVTVLAGATATVTDADGTVSAGLPAGLSHTWSNAEEGTLTPPQSIAAVGGPVWVGWTQK